jgi:hypothetical protein
MANVTNKSKTYGTQTVMSQNKGGFQGSVQQKSKLSGGFGPFGIKYGKPIGPVKPVGLRMDEYSRQLLAKLKQPVAAAPKPKPKPAQVIRTTVSERVTPVSAKATAPTRMAVNRATGDTTGFTTGTRTGSTATKAGVATRTSKTAMERMNQNAINKGSSAGSSKSGASRSTGGASRSTGNSLGSSGRGTGSKK